MCDYVGNIVLKYFIENYSNIMLIGDCRKLYYKLYKGYSEDLKPEN